MSADKCPNIHIAIILDNKIMVQFTSILMFVTICGVFRSKTLNCNSSENEFTLNKQCKLEIVLIRLVIL